MQHIYPNHANYSHVNKQRKRDKEKCILNKIEIKWIYSILVCFLNVGSNIKKLNQSVHNLKKKK